jgi:hypothetical protein
MKDLSNQRCYHHQRREAVVRCPDCQRFFCRECVTEHSDRMLCAQCLARVTDKGQKRAAVWVRGLLMMVQGTFGFLLLWYAFYLVGLMLLSIPDSFHEGTIWGTQWWNQK